MKMTGDDFKHDKAKRNAIIQKLVDYGVSALSSKEVVFMADSFAKETIDSLNRFWDGLVATWPDLSDETPQFKKEFYQKHLDAMETEARKLYDAACEEFKLPVNERHKKSFPIIPKVRTIYEPPKGVKNEGTIMVVLSMGLLKGVGKDGEWDLALAKKVFTNKFLLASIDAFNTTDNPDEPCGYTIVCTEAHTLEGLGIKESRPWHTPKKDSEFWKMCKNILKLQIGSYAPKVLCLHSAPARGVFGFEEGEIGFSGEDLHHVNFEDVNGNSLVDFNIFIEAFDHPASARFVRLFWQMTREAKKLSKLIGA